MKNLIMLGVLILSLPAIAAKTNGYQYKDISSKQARAFDDHAEEKRQNEVQQEKHKKTTLKTIEETIQDRKAASEKDGK